MEKLPFLTYVKANLLNEIKQEVFKTYMDYSVVMAVTGRRYH